jgi:hypothetical protein
MFYVAGATNKDKKQIKPLQQIKYIKTEKLFLLFYHSIANKDRRKETPKK